MSLSGAVIDRARLSGSEFEAFGQRVRAHHLVGALPAPAGHGPGLRDLPLHVVCRGGPGRPARGAVRLTTPSSSAGRGPGQRGGDGRRGQRQDPHAGRPLPAPPADDSRRWRSSPPPSPRRRRPSCARGSAAACRPRARATSGPSPNWKRRRSAPFTRCAPGSCGTIPGRRACGRTRRSSTRGRPGSGAPVTCAAALGALPGRLFTHLSFAQMEDAVSALLDDPLLAERALAVGGGRWEAWAAQARGEALAALKDIPAWRTRSRPCGTTPGRGGRPHGGGAPGSPGPRCGPLDTADVAGAVSGLLGLKLTGGSAKAWPAGALPLVKDAVRTLREHLEAAQQTGLLTLAAGDGQPLAGGGPAGPACGLRHGAGETLGELKRRAGVLDFADIEVHALRALRDEAGAGALPRPLAGVPDRRGAGHQPGAGRDPGAADGTGAADPGRRREAEHLQLPPGGPGAVPGGGGGHRGLGGRRGLRWTSVSARTRRWWARPTRSSRRCSARCTPR